MTDMTLKRVNEQVVVLMGASSGIGRQTALDFARRGAKIVAAARDEAGLASLEQEVFAAGGDLITVAADTATFNDVKYVADRAIEAYGRIDTWVHLAAVTLYATFEQTTPDEWRRVIDVNLNGQAYGAMAALPHLRRTGRGALIHVSSIEARRGLPYQSAYAASKHGITGFLEALRLELKHEGVPISVTEILPASVNTPLFDKARTKMGVKPIGIKPMYQPKVVADAILHAAEHPIREFVVGGAAKALQFTQELSSGLTDRILLKVGFEGQKTEERKHDWAPDNLFAPLDGFDRVQGDWNGRAMGRSVSNWMQKHPVATKLIALGAFSIAAGLALRGDDDEA
jgi:NAD(P)-dependent dehydrogenase (short-subunit alcohol dehydrogenase family)